MRPGPEPVATYLYYDGWNLVQEGTAPNSPTRLYVHGGRADEVVAQINPENNQLRYFQYDARGHCVFQTDPAGYIKEQYEYDAFGLPYFFDGSGNPTTLVNGQPGSLWENRILFTGREYLNDMRIYDFRHRVYHPELGRFLQPDPKHFEAKDYNLYRYCHNDPVNRNDPMGLADSVTIEFVPAIGKQFVQILPDRVVDAACPGCDAASLMAPNGGLTTTATIDKTTGDIHVYQRIKIESWIKESQDKAGKTPELRRKELLRVDKFREGLPEAQRKADALAAQGFKDEASAKKAVEESTKGQMLKQAREGKIKWDLPGGKH